MEGQQEVQSEILETSKKEAPVIKVQLPKEVAIRVQSALQTLKERKADTKADELLSEFLNSVSDTYLEEQIERRTPEDYYFEAARSIPELREKIIKEAKRALQKTDRIPVGLIAAESKKSKKKAKTDESAPESLTGEGGIVPIVEATEMTQ